MAEQYAFLVRGAKLRCDKGSHARKLNLPLCHGVYSGIHPLVHDEDCVLVENITEFGICSSETNPAASSGAKIILVGEDGANVKGIPCTPMLIGKWMNPHPAVKIAKNEGAAAGGDASARSYAAALTMDSCLICAYGGVIYPEESGQDEFGTSPGEDDDLITIGPDGKPQSNDKSPGNGLSKVEGVLSNGYPNGGNTQSIDLSGVGDASAVQAAFQNSARGGDDDGVYGLQCVDMTNWFIKTYTTLKPSLGNGCDKSANVATANGLPAPTSIPVGVPAVFSVAAGYSGFGGSGGKYGHTGIVIGIDEAAGKATVIHTWIGLTGQNPNSRISTHDYPSPGVTFTYLGDHMK